ncbi:type II CAAX endopeptidase family protein [Pontimicrobium sp. SW4]|uniref:Type II CAAX endopeptidase family protein n=1 Tax=Pontimicrobium sp. SW4 TaxID=3153519 RepID=A0AAU7BUY7_9FLAO
MKYSKAITLTLLYFISLEILSLWIIIIPFGIGNLNLYKASHLINSIALLIFIVLFFKKIEHSNLLVLNKTKLKFYLFAILLGIGFVFFQSVLKIIYYQEISPDFFSYRFTLNRLKTYDAVASIMIVPIIEELFFRNYLQGALAKNYKPIKTILFASLLFAFIHIPFATLFFDSLDFSLRSAFIALFGGFIAGILYYKSKSIGPSIIFHVFWNLTSYIV